MSKFEDFLRKAFTDEAETPSDEAIKNYEVEDWPEPLEEGVWEDNQAKYKANLEAWLQKSDIDVNDIKNFGYIYFIGADNTTYKIANVFIEHMLQYAGPYNHNVITDELKDKDVKFVGVETGSSSTPYGQYRGYSESESYVSFNSKLADPALFGIKDYNEDGCVGGVGHVYKDFEFIKKNFQYTAERNFLTKYGMDTWFYEETWCDSTD